MNYRPVLENKRVLLRPLELSDIDLLRPVALQQPDLFRFMSSYILSEEDLVSVIHQAIRDREEERSIPFMVWDKKTGRAAGSTRFGNMDRQHKRIEIGWTWIGAEFHGSGLNKAMKYLMLAHAFEVLDCNRVEIKTSEKNLRSQRAIQSIGATYEGLLRHHMVNDDGSLRNTMYYSILKEEWPGIKERIFAPYFPGWY